MAEMNNQQEHRQGRRSIKKSTRVDMTPMVDLGFLLITFFMLATTMSKPRSMSLIMPREDGDSMSLPAKQALTVILGQHNNIAWYEGMENAPADVHYTTFANNNGIRDVIVRQKEAVMKFYGKNDLMILIKANPEANYKNVVDILDEMAINKIDRYALVDLTREEATYFEK
ncbi:biopolymer transporter ExbD [Chitinophaga silvatica]|uniref:Biopolymer transporter ExbD n=1 Tax=Chitinophaga silvatica TaxID=2282649 RepID=A0A3E1YCL9_9BACT|nr:biopolymer transporter ExbD [Chitinophaga silvatica]RFS24033.1 biopolymer transporter ExbD [Chitinophaga silvatica]